MPCKRTKMFKAMIGEYGKKKGTEVFFATKRKRK